MTSIVNEAASLFLRAHLLDPINQELLTKMEGWIGALPGVDEPVVEFFSTRSGAEQEFNIRYYEQGEQKEIKISLLLSSKDVV